MGKKLKETTGIEVENGAQGQGEKGKEEAFRRGYDAFWGKGSSETRGRVLRTLTDTPPYSQTISRVKRTLADTPTLSHEESRR